MIQSRNKYHVREWLNQLPQALIKPFGHVTIIILMLKHHKIHVGSAIWLQVTLLLFKVVAKAKYKISYEIHRYMFSINLSFTMEGENILCMNNYEHWKLETCTCIKWKLAQFITYEVIKAVDIRYINLYISRTARLYKLRYYLRQVFRHSELIVSDS